MDPTTLAALVGGSAAAVVIAVPFGRLLRLPVVLSRLLLPGARSPHARTLRARPLRADAGALAWPVLAALGALVGLVGAVGAMANPPAAPPTALLGALLGSITLSAVALLLPGVLAKRREACPVRSHPANHDRPLPRAA